MFIFPKVRLRKMYDFEYITRGSSRPSFPFVEGEGSKYLSTGNVKAKTKGNRANNI